jgi:hypothetical protein
MLDITTHAMKSIALGIAFLLVPFVSSAQEPFSGEFQLKAKTQIKGVMLSPDYRIIVDGGNATVKFTKDGKPQEAKGTVVLSYRNGIDPATKRPAKFSGFLRVEVTNSGWARDKFITRIEIPMQPTGATQKGPDSPDPQPVIGFASTASVELLWLDVLSNGLSSYSDPMGIRMNADYAVDVVKNPIK